MIIQRLAPTHATMYQAMMLEAYALHPESFTSDPLERHALPIEWWENRLKDETEPSEVVFGAMDNGRLSGVVGLSFSTQKKTRHKAVIFGMYVPLGQRQKGIGAQLLGTLLSYSKTRLYVTVLQLTVSEGNVAARKLYEDFGFVTFGVEPLAVANDDGYVSKIHMWRDLRRQ
jgi:ribosomal protein S18 acetylase RimI-like enzyme